MTLSEMATEMLEHVDAFRNPSCEGLYAKIHALCVAVLAKESTATCGVLGAMTPAEHAALKRLRNIESSTRLSGNPWRDDLIVAAKIALRDYPVDDTCEMSRQELIAEVARLKKRDTGAVC